MQRTTDQGVLAATEKLQYNSYTSGWGNTEEEREDCKNHKNTMIMCSMEDAQPQNNHTETVLIKSLGLLTLASYWLALLS